MKLRPFWCTKRNMGIDSLHCVNNNDNRDNNNDDDDDDDDESSALVSILAPCIFIYTLK